MSVNRDQAREAANYVLKNVSEPPRIGILTGTGLGKIADTMDGVIGDLAYTTIPHFPQATVQSHQGRLFVGEIGGKNIAAFHGRVHLYEGYSPQAVAFPIRVMQEMGIKIVILTNAAGGLNPDFSAGDIMIIQDHINLTGHNPLIGPNDNQWGIRFPDMSCVYDPQLFQLAENTADALGLGIQKGVYTGLVGPSLETPAEVQFLQTIGGDAVGFSTVSEATACVHAGMRILGLSVITNVHRAESKSSITIEEVISVAGSTAPHLKMIIRGIIEQINLPS